MQANWSCFLAQKFKGARFFTWNIENCIQNKAYLLLLRKIFQKYTGSKRQRLNHWAVIKLNQIFVISMKFEVDLVCFKRNPKFTILDDFPIFSTEAWNRPQVRRRSRICGSFWCHTNFYTTINEFKNRK